MTEYQLNKLETAEKVPFNFDGRILFISDRYELVHLTIQPGEAMEMHSQPFDVVFFVLDGTGSLSIGDEILDVGKNTTIHVKTGVFRAWKNAGSNPLKVLVSKLTGLTGAGI